MRNLLIFLLFTLSLHSQEFGDMENFTTDIVGKWQSFDNEFVSIQRDGSFIRVEGKEVKSKGILRQNNGRLYIKRTDIEDEYVLSYYERNDVLVITKPRSMQAWLFYRIGY